MKALGLIDRLFILKKNVLFRELDLDLLLTIADKMTPIMLENGATIFSCHQEANRMYLIAEGVVEIRNSKGRSVATLNSFDFLGEESLFNGRPRGYDALCRTDTTLLSLTKTHLLAIISECPSVAISLLETYAEHFDFRIPH